MSQILAFTSAVLFGVADFTGGLASRTISAWRVLAWSQLLGLPLVLLAIVTVSPSEFTTHDLVFGVAAGVFGLVGLGLLYKALASGTMSIVSPIVGVVSASIPVAWGLASGERLSAAQWVGVIAAVVAVLLIAGHRAHTRPRTTTLIQAFGAAGAFAIFFIAMDQTSQESGLWPLLASRTATVPIGFMIAGLTASVAVPPRSILPKVAFTGIADVGGNIAVLVAIQTGPLGITAVLSGLYPAFTAITAIAVLRERPTRQQGIGIALAVTAGAILTL